MTDCLSVGTQGKGWVRWRVRPTPVGRAEGSGRYRMRLGRGTSAKEPKSSCHFADEPNDDAVDVAT